MELGNGMRNLLRSGILIIALLLPTTAMAFAGRGDQLNELLINLLAIGVVVLLTQIVAHVVIVRGNRWCWLNNRLKRLAIKISANKWRALPVSWLLTACLTASYGIVVVVVFGLYLMMWLLVMGYIGEWCRWILLLAPLFLLIIPIRKFLLGNRSMYLMLHGLIQQLVGYVLYALICSTPLLQSWLFVKDSEYEYNGFATYPGWEAFGYVAQCFIGLMAVWGISYLLLALFMRMTCLLKKRKEKRAKTYCGD